MIDLVREFDTARRALREQIGDPVPPGLGLKWIETDGRFWQPGGVDAVLAVIVGEFVGENLVDLVSFDPSRPTRAWVRTGCAAMLGEENFLDARFMGEPLLVHADPVAYCRAAGRGIVILDGDFLRLIDLPDLQFDDRVFAVRVKRAQNRPRPTPRFHVKAA
jgi:hypothetical protein